jgi:hypothetical protein
MNGENSIFREVKRLKITVAGVVNFPEIFFQMRKQSIDMLKSVEELVIDEVYGGDDKGHKEVLDQLAELIASMSSLKHLKGNSNIGFNPFPLLKEKKIKIEKLTWATPSTPELRNDLLEYLHFNNV